MRRLKSTEEQTAFALKQVELGFSVAECCRKLGVSKQTLSRWKKKLGGLGVAEVRRLKMLEEENRKLQQLVADLSLDMAMLQDSPQRKLKGQATSVAWPSSCRSLSG